MTYDTMMEIMMLLMIKMVLVKLLQMMPMTKKAMMTMTHLRVGNPRASSRGPR